MIDAGWIKLKPQEGQPSVTENPFPNHDGKGSATVNALDGLAHLDSSTAKTEIARPARAIKEGAEGEEWLLTLGPLGSGYWAAEGAWDDWD